jgi:hypothetical protein
MAASKNQGQVFEANVPILIRFRWFRRCICGSEIIRGELEGVLLL